MPWFSRLLAPLIHHTTRAAVGLIYPPACAHCDGEMLAPDDDVLLCEPCRKLLAGRRSNVCLRCAAVVDSVGARAECPRCRGVKYQFTNVIALGSYHGELREAVLRLKLPGAEPLAAALGQLLVDTRRAELLALGVDMVVPAPMHWRRRMARGVNGPELIAAAIARRLGAPRFRQALVRQRHTLRQTDVPADQRAANVRGAFRPANRFQGRGAKALLVDDILTTGATANEAARALVEAGVSEVFVAAIARADSPDGHF